MIAIFVPSRGRPRRAAEMVQSVRDTATGPVTVVVAVDPDDPTVAEYQRKVPGVVVLPERLRYVATLNRLAAEHWDTHDILGAYGDDVIFRTRGWDERIQEALATPGIAFGNDLAHQDGFPTAVFMSSVIAQALGWLALPRCRHLYVDNAWQLIGERLGILRYLPDVVIEHMHEVYGKAPKDQTYIDVYDDNGALDYGAYQEWLADGCEADIAHAARAIA